MGQHGHLMNCRARVRGAGGRLSMAVCPGGRGMRRGRAAAALIAVLGLEHGAAWGQCSYSFVPAPDPHPSSFIGFFPTSIGEDGVVGGFITTEPDIPAFWEPGVGLFVLPRPSGSTERVAVWDVLNREAMVGGMADTVPIFWRNGQWEVLPAPEGRGLASGINRHLQIVGDVSGTNMDGLSTPDIPALWDNGQYVELPMPDGATRARATHINDHGLIAGWAQFEGGLNDNKIVVWRHRQPEILGSIPGGIAIRPSGLSNDGTIVGSDWDPAQLGNRPFVWMNGTFGLLPEPDGSLSGAARDVSDGRQTIGSVQTPAGQLLGVLWQHGQMYDLSALNVDGFSISEARAINDNGVIVVAGGVLVPIGPAPGDVDYDCRVNVTDLLLLLAEWGNEGSFADVTDDGVVNHWDLIELLINWG